MKIFFGWGGLLRPLGETLVVFLALCIPAVDILGELLVCPQTADKNLHFNHGISQSRVFLDEVGVVSDERIHGFRSSRTSVLASGLEAIRTAEEVKKIKKSEEIRGKEVW